MKIDLDKPETYPGHERVVLRRERSRQVLAIVAAILWPPAILTLPIWTPSNWMPGLEMDWRLVLLLIGAVAVPFGVLRLQRVQAKTSRPATRLGLVWRFMFYGGLLAAVLMATLAVIVAITNWFSMDGFGPALGSTITSLLIFGVGGLPFAVLIGVSYALWAGLCVAFIAYAPQPQVRDRIGVMGDRTA